MGIYKISQAGSFRSVRTNVKRMTGSSDTAIAIPLLSGGTLTSDATYYYRTFTASGTLTVQTSQIQCDMLTVAGGGGGAGEL